MFRLKKTEPILGVHRTSYGEFISAGIDTYLIELYAISIQHYKSIKGKVNSFVGARYCTYHVSVRTLQITSEKRIQKKAHVCSQKCGKATSRPVENGGRGHNYTLVREE
jgi:hypothetical protein